MKSKRDFGVLNIIIVALVFLGLGIIGGFYYFSDNVKLSGATLTPDVFGHDGGGVNVYIASEGVMTLQEAIDNGKIGGSGGSCGAILSGSITKTAQDISYSHNPICGSNEVVVGFDSTGAGDHATGVYPLCQQISSCGNGINNLVSTNNWEDVPLTDTNLFDVNCEYRVKQPGIRDIWGNIIGNATLYPSEVTAQWLIIPYQASQTEYEHSYNPARVYYLNKQFGRYQHYAPQTCVNNLCNALLTFTSMQKRC
ncbi:MAG: hypothetical protein AABX11_00105 [Nanoarchaeota archaeon]